MPDDLEALAALVSGAGFVAAGEEAAELLARAAGDAELLDSLVGRRLTGEPLAWITGSVAFCGIEIRVDPGVYVPRWQSEPLARRAVERLPANGAAIDLCTGAGAVAKTLISEPPRRARWWRRTSTRGPLPARRRTAWRSTCGDLFAPLPRALEGRVDVVVGVVPYVPTRELALLQRDTFTFESRRSYDGGRDGTDDPPARPAATVPASCGRAERSCSSSAVSRRTRSRATSRASDTPTSRFSLTKTVTCAASRPGCRGTAGGARARAAGRGWLDDQPPLGIGADSSFCQRPNSLP